MKIGANAPCPCESGQKYKRCCKLKSQSSVGYSTATGDIYSQWGDCTDEILKDEPKAELIKSIFFSMIEAINGMNWRGACHQVSATLYILFKEIELNAELCSGGVVVPNFGAFPHTWIEIDGKVYDATIWNQGAKEIQRAPIIASRHIDTAHETNLLYGVKGVPFDEGVHQTLTIPLVDLMRGEIPIDGGVTWDVLYNIADKIGIKLDGRGGEFWNAEKLTQRYANVYAALKQEIENPFLAHQRP